MKVDISAIKEGDTIHWKDTVGRDSARKVVKKSSVVASVIPCLNNDKVMFSVRGDNFWVRGEQITKHEHWTGK